MSDEKKFFDISKNVAGVPCCSKITAHCICLTGIVETCSHLGSIMFFVEAAVRLQEADRYPGSCVLEIAFSREAS